MHEVCFAREGTPHGQTILVDNIQNDILHTRWAHGLLPAWTPASCDTCRVPQSPGVAHVTCQTQGLRCCHPFKRAQWRWGSPSFHGVVLDCTSGGRAQPWIICMRSSKVACSGRSGTYIPRSVIEHGESEGLALEYYKSYDVRSLF